MVGIDGSTTSRRALDWALDAARAHRSRIEVVHAWHPSYVNPMDAYLISSADVLEQSARTVLDEAIARADDHDLAQPDRGTARARLRRPSRRSTWPRAPT